MSSHGKTRLIFKIHSYTGLINWYSFASYWHLKGSILVFSRDLDRLIYKDIQEVEPVGKRISLDSGYSLMKSKFPNMNYLTYDGLPKNPESSFQFFMMTDGVQFKALPDPLPGKFFITARDMTTGWIGCSYFITLSLFMFGGSSLRISIHNRNHRLLNLVSSRE